MAGTLRLKEMATYASKSVHLFTHFWTTSTWENEIMVLSPMGKINIQITAKH
jgi:hypothetical protein